MAPALSVPDAAGAAVPAEGAMEPALTNTEALGQVLYTDYAFHFELAGLILLVAMIGAIVLTLHHKDGVKRQSISAQVGRKRKDAVELVKVAPGGAILPSADDSG